MLCRALIAVLCVFSSLTSAVADGLTYLAHPPVVSSAHPPLIVLLHGSGADERDMIGLWRDLPQDFVVVSPRAPFAKPGGGYIWYRKTGAQPRAGDLAAAAKAIDLVVDSAVKRFNAAPSRLFIGGFSQGAVMTYQIALNEPGRFRGAAVLSGSLFASSAASAKASTTPFFIAHGTADQRIPFAAATAARAMLAKHGVHIAFHAYPGMGHETPAVEIRDMRAWLEQNERR